MKKYTAFATHFVIIAAVAGCAWTDVSSFRDPAFIGKRFQRILVIAPFGDMDSRTKTEQAFSVRLAKYEVEVIPSMGVLMPTRTYTDDELFKLLNENNIDGVLHVELTDAYTKQTYMPRSSYTHGQASLSANTVTYSGTTQHYGGYYISKPRVKFKMRLYDVSTGKTAWVATSLTRGNAFANFSTLIGSLADTAAEKLQEEGFLGGKKKE